MAPVDPHSYTDGAHPVTTHADLAFYLDFATSTIHASALLTLSEPHSGVLLLDTRALAVHSAFTTSNAPDPIPFSLAADADPVLGSALALTLPAKTSSFLLTFSTSPSASALQWLEPPRSASSLPFVFSQCQYIHARSIFPCHDTPAARITYSLLLNVPSQLSAVAAARHLYRRDPVSSDHRGACNNALWCAPGRSVEVFDMAQSVPPYLFAFAAGGIGFRDIGPRTRVYAEGGDTLLDEAAKEFAGLEEMLKAGEALFGPYEWERFNMLLLPALTEEEEEDKQIVMHKLALGWAGNLITNKTNEDFWLNEGFTTYAERRITEVVQGDDQAALKMGIGWMGLNQMIDRFKDNMEYTKLKPKMAGVNPDDVCSEVHTEKGFQFLWRIERQIGRPSFDEFLKKYIATFKFQSIDTDKFLEFLKANVPGIEEQIDLHQWIEGTGIPPDAMEPESDVYKKICSLAAEFKSGKVPSDDEVANWSGHEWELFLKNLPLDVDASKVLSQNKTRKKNCASGSRRTLLLPRAILLAASPKLTSRWHEVSKEMLNRVCDLIQPKDIINLKLCCREWQKNTRILYAADNPIWFGLTTQRLLFGSSKHKLMFSVKHDFKLSNLDIRYCSSNQNLITLVASVGNEVSVIDISKGSFSNLPILDGSVESVYQAISWPVEGDIFGTLVLCRREDDLAISIHCKATGWVTTSHRSHFTPSEESAPLIKGNLVYFIGMNCEIAVFDLDRRIWRSRGTPNWPLYDYQNAHILSSGTEILAAVVDRMHKARPIILKLDEKKAI